MMNQPQMPNSMANINMNGNMKMMNNVNMMNPMYMNNGNMMNMNMNNMNFMNNMNNMNNMNMQMMMMMMNNKQLMFNNQNQMIQYQKNNNKKLNQIVGIESVIPIQTTSKDIIDDKQYDIITQICVEAIKDKKKDIASYCTEKIMNKLKGQWFVLIHNSNEDNFEFRFSKFQYKKLLIFQYGEKIVYVLPLK